ncbi:MAG: methyl-accepting chemotaxis protein, partial [Spirochaetales bacterium]|nr:methyl-accepting chemotaxis protein [Spirochaetales bacterium]
MKLKTNLFILVLIPVLGLSIVFILGVRGFSNIGESLPRLNEMQADRALILNGDRDAYQALLAENNSIQNFDRSELQSIFQSMEENQIQTRERVAGPALRNSEKMILESEDFLNYYNDWTAHNEAIKTNTLAIAENELRRQKLLNSSLKGFGMMRDVIDRMSEVLEGEQQGVSVNRRLTLSSALQYILSADRDAYQAYTSLLLLDSAETEDDLELYSGSFSENAAQTEDRIRRGVELSGTVIEDLYGEFEEYYNSWYSDAQNSIELAGSNFTTLRLIEEEREKGRASFDSMREVIDSLGELQDERTLSFTEDIADSLRGLLITYCIVVLLTFLLAVAASLIISRFIFFQLGDDPSVIAEIAESVANGKLDIQKAGEKQKVVGVFASIRKMVENLIHIIEEINTSSRHVESGSQQMTIAAQQLSQGAQM